MNLDVYKSHSQESWVGIHVHSDLNPYMELCKGHFLLHWSTVVYFQVCDIYYLYRCEFVFQKPTSDLMHVTHRIVITYLGMLDTE